MMDLGAALCRPTPECGACPIAQSCRWHLAGLPAPDPAVGSAGVSGTQAPFEGSDRQARGRVLRALDGGPQARSCFDERVVSGLVDDGLVEPAGDRIRLPT